MQYHDQQPTEGINYTKEHPLKRFAILLLAAAILIVLLVVALQFSGAWIAKRIPFSFEQKIAGNFSDYLGDTPSDSDIEVYLNALASDLMQHMDIPEGMTVKVNYMDDDVFNAFATIGGNLVFYRGLVEKMPNENALAMVMAHEIAHILHRDPIAGLGGGVASTVALLAVTGHSGVAGNVLGGAASLTSVQFTRGMENAADETALAAVNDRYGHVNGAATLFEIMAEKRGKDGKLPESLQRFASTHPLDQDRIDGIAEQAEANGWSVSGELTPLPAQFKSWL